MAERDNRFLLVRELIKGQEVLNQPAGHLDPGESLEQACIRETMEETSYEFMPDRLCGVYRWHPENHTEKTYLRFSFSGKVGKNLNKPLDSGILRAEWLTLEEIHQNQQALRTPMVLQCILDYLHKPSYPLKVFNPDFL